MSSVFRLFCFILISIALCAPARSESLKDVKSHNVVIYADSATQSGYGSGFFISRDGLIATAYHVVEGADKLRIYDHKGNKYDRVRLMNYDLDSDIAILKVTPKIRLRSIVFASGMIKADWDLFIIGNPLGQIGQILRTYPTHDGLKSSLLIMDQEGQRIFRSDIPVVQIDATVYNGLSGSMVVKENGEVIGLLSASLTEGGSIAWIIPSSAIEGSLQMNDGRLIRQIDSWPKLRLMSVHFRSLRKDYTQSVSDIMNWLNRKWKQYKLGEYTYKDRNVSIQSTKIENEGHVLRIITSLKDKRKGQVWDVARERVQILEIELPFLESASAQLPHRLSTHGFGVSLTCYDNIACMRKSIGDKDSITNPRFKRYDRGTLPHFYFEGRNLTAHVARGFEHLIRLFGGPRQKFSQFE